ncbi:MAG: exo-poly-alpha-D-galacturonosidase [Sphingobacteriales bacterium 50-39]|nr:right-handed parallel beta-helix repeat-containing protein [Sphingobacteriales bacterium]OJW60960.1 MAG: exo-poly-alpha-D-galacturonosidase [Sphingobacteriales bacterium 50-39]
MICNPLNRQVVKNIFILGIFLLSTTHWTIASPTNPFFNVKDFGARGDGKTLDARAINQAIAAATAAGGGTVYLPAGNYLSGSIRLKSNITLFIDQGATITAAPVNTANEYDDEEPGPGNEYQDLGHSHWHNSLIWGEDLHDVAILGQGLINGKNLYRSSFRDSKQSANKAIALLRCINVTIRDISILHGGWFAILATGVDNFTLDNVKMDTNRDGVDIDCCRNVRVSNCYVNSPYDDAICLKSSYALGYARPTENVTITNCQVSGYDEGTLLDGTYKRTENPKYKFSPIGRIKFGTESNGGFKNITISNCVFEYCKGLALESVDGALLEDVTVTNITMRDVVRDPIFIRLGARMRGPAGTPVGAIRRVLISNVVAYNVDTAGACTIAGIPGHYIEDITLNNIRIYHKGGGSKEESKKQIPEMEDKYPEPGMFHVTPAYGLFIRHAKNIKVMDVEINLLQADGRPPLKLDDTKDIYIRRLVTSKRPAGQ